MFNQEQYPPSDWVDPSDVEDLESVTSMMSCSSTATNINENLEMLVIDPSYPDIAVRLEAFGSEEAKAEYREAYAAYEIEKETNPDAQPPVVPARKKKKKSQSAKEPYFPHPKFAVLNPPQSTHPSPQVPSTTDQPTQPAPGVQTQQRMPLSSQQSQLPQQAHGYPPGGPTSQMPRGPPPSYSQQPQQPPPTAEQDEPIILQFHGVGEPYFFLVEDPLNQNIPEQWLDQGCLFNKYHVKMFIDGSMQVTNYVTGVITNLPPGAQVIARPPKGVPLTSMPPIAQPAELTGEGFQPSFGSYQARSWQYPQQNPQQYPQQYPPQYSQQRPQRFPQQRQQQFPQQRQRQFPRQRQQHFQQQRQQFPHQFQQQRQQGQQQRPQQRQRQRQQQFTQQRQQQRQPQQSAGSGPTTDLFDPPASNQEKPTGPIPQQLPSDETIEQMVGAKVFCSKKDPNDHRIPPVITPYGDASELSQVHSFV